MIGRLLLFLERVLYPNEYVMDPGRFESFILGVAKLPSVSARKRA